MDVFQFRKAIIKDYETFSRSFTRIRAPDIRRFAEETYRDGYFWPAPLIQLNPSFVAGRTIEELVRDGIVDPECAVIFRAGKERGGAGTSLRLHCHQEEALVAAQREAAYVLTTGTGSGKSLAYFVPIVDAVLKERRAGAVPGRIRAIVIYPMNALCNSQHAELAKFLADGYGPGCEPVTFGRYTGQETQEEHERVANNPPDILLTNFMMLELLVTRQDDRDRSLMNAAQGLRFLVLDELHTYRGRQGADVALLVRRVRERLNPTLLCVGTSATMASEGNAASRRAAVAGVATRLFGASVAPENVITETLERVTPEVPLDASWLKEGLEAGWPEGAAYEVLRVHPLASWVESRMGLQREEGKWIR
ncbi:MAG: DEAD/DEAH box helicase, partial [Gammaproteobacteria bacterium]|nr:DEAD/DEAH box helicase [Gammaproteobacteria bacterium]